MQERGDTLKETKRTNKAPRNKSQAHPNTSHRYLRIKEDFDIDLIIQDAKEWNTEKGVTGDDARRHLGNTGQDIGKALQAIIIKRDGMS